MEILGIGFGELILIVLIILILFGPKEMVKTGKTLGQWLNRLVHSPTYKLVSKTGEELKSLPRTLMREANLEEAEREFKEIGKDLAEQKKTIGNMLARSFDEKQIFDSLETAAKPEDTTNKPEDKSHHTQQANDKNTPSNQERGPEDKESQ